MLFGSFPKITESGSSWYWNGYGAHAVVGYGYERYGFLGLGLAYRVHYGWEVTGGDFSDIHLDNGVHGSNLKMLAR